VGVELGSISATFSSLIYVPPREERGRSAGSFPDQRLVIEPSVEPQEKLLLQVTKGERDAKNSESEACQLGDEFSGYTL